MQRNKRNKLDGAKPVHLHYDDYVLLDGILEDLKREFMPCLSERSHLTHARVKAVRSALEAAHLAKESDEKNNDSRRRDAFPR